jgi:hypothetical protein
MRRIVPILLLFVLIPAVVAAGGYWWAGSHAPLPGLRGCGYIRATAARGSCVQGELEGAMRGRSVESGLRRVDALARTNELVESHCHLAMHPIGERAGRQAARDDKRPPVSRASSNCRRGYMHGVMIGYVTRRGSIVDALPTLCEREHQSDTECAHVVGHLLAREAQSSHREQALVDGCTAATNVAASSRAECVRGGLMEIALIDHEPPLRVWAARCARAPQQVRVACFGWLVPIGAYRESSRSEVQSVCQRQQSTVLRADCTSGIASAYAKTSPTTSR